ncbi:MAG: efflux RND transporter periplasmic adaptor subunit [Verrucomicrobia bacterium]|nr:efflux RND transporter periplasmic adaptor subunit [Verrucomicrobiota bacterium]
MSARQPSSSAAARRNHQRARTWRGLPWLGAALLVGLVVAGLWPGPVPVETAPATRGALRATIAEEGKTRIRHRYLVSAPVTGQLRRIELKPGAAVVAGQVLAVIDPVKPALLDARTRSLAEARRDAAAANLAKALKAHEFAASELKRFERLYAEKTVSVQELEAVQWREAAAVKDKAAAESALRQAEAELAEFTTTPGAAPSPIEICAPATGRVLRVFEESARVVGVGAPLLELGDPADLEVVIEVLSRDGAAIAPGTPIELHQWGGDAPLKAVARLVEPAAFTKVSALGVEEQRVNLIADIVTPPEERPRLGDGFRVEARIIVWEAADVLKVPAGAVFRRGTDWAVFVTERGRARLRLVKTGRSSGTETQILEGLREGEEVVQYPGDRVNDGQRVTPLQIQR